MRSAKMQLAIVTVIEGSESVGGVVNLLFVSPTGAAPLQELIFHAQ